MARPAPTKPTDGELEILQIFWTRGEATVRDIHDEVLKSRKVAPTTVATTIQIMHDKGLLQLVDERRPQKYRATRSEEEIGRSLVEDLVRRAFGGSMRRLMTHALGNKSGKVNRAEIDDLLKKLE